MNKEIIALSLVIVGFLGVVAVAEFGSYLYEAKIACPHFAQNVERPYKYDYFGGGCFVQDSKGQWVKSENYWNNASK